MADEDGLDGLNGLVAQLDELVRMKALEDVGVRKLQQLSRAVAESKGWTGDATEASIPSLLINIHGEVSEAWEEFRLPDNDLRVSRYENGKLKGFPTELADIVIRTMDTADRMGIDLLAAITEKMKYNTTRSFRHGGKKV